MPARLNYLRYLSSLCLLTIATAAPLPALATAPELCSQHLTEVQDPKASLEDWIAFVRQYPHEFTIQYPPRREYFQEKFKTAPLAVSPDPLKPWLIYVHVPFCEAKCYFCNFAVDVRNNPDLYQAYVGTLEQQLKDLEPNLRPGRIGGIDIGGGTPTRLPVPELERLVRALQPFQQASNHPFPTSIETTPSIASEEPEKLVILKENGVGRVSMGVQSFNIDQIQAVNRKFQMGRNELAAENIHALRFERFNVDLIFGLPGQSDDQWREDLRRVVALNPDSITTYDCLYRGKGRALAKRTENLPTMEDYGRLYDIAYDFLTSRGFKAHYGSVNFSKRPNDLGTSTYFEGRMLSGAPYVGLGNYASSWINDRWFFNVRGVGDYIEQVQAGADAIGDFYVLPPRELYAKYILYSLNYGIVDTLAFRKRFGVEFDQLFARELELAQAQGWIKPSGPLWTIPYGQFKSLNFLRSLFYTDEAKRWLKALR